MYTIWQVVEGLGKGTSYERDLTAGESEGPGKYLLRPAEGGWVRYDVVGTHPTLGGWGGSAELPAKTLLNGRIPQDGWRVSPNPS